VPDTNGRLGSTGAGGAAAGTCGGGSAGGLAAGRRGRRGRGEAAPGAGSAEGVAEADATGEGEPDGEADVLGSGVPSGDGDGEDTATVAGGTVRGFEGHNVSNVRPAQKPKATSKMARTSVPRLEPMPREPAGFSPSAFAIGP
jgi:hypothetical protein